MWFSVSYSGFITRLCGQNSACGVKTNFFLTMPKVIYGVYMYFIMIKVGIFPFRDNDPLPAIPGVFRPMNLEMW
jgi:hypothetical protein